GKEGIYFKYEGSSETILEDDFHGLVVHLLGNAIILWSFYGTQLLLMGYCMICTAHLFREDHIVAFLIMQKCYAILHVHVIWIHEPIIIMYAALEPFFRLETSKEINIA
ncbi:hypothetical protein ACJX0J_008716, partial [Zea mays]